MWTKTAWKDTLLPALLVSLSGGNDCGAVFACRLDPPTRMDSLVLATCKKSATLLLVPFRV
jgi:hypothetical protein